MSGISINIISNNKYFIEYDFKKYGAGNSANKIKVTIMIKKLVFFSPNIIGIVFIFETRSPDSSSASLINSRKKEKPIVK